MSEIKTLNGYSFVDETAREAANTNATAIDSLSEEKANKLNVIPYKLPVLRLTGDTSGMSKDNAVTLDYVYGDKSGTASVKWQGSSSLSYPKKNYTIKFDEAFEAKEGWGAEKKYCFKANFIDHSHARNICSCIKWGNMVKTRAKNLLDLSKVTRFVNDAGTDLTDRITVTSNDSFYTQTSNSSTGVPYMEGIVYPKGVYRISFKAAHSQAINLRVGFVSTSDTSQLAKTQVTWESNNKVYDIILCNPFDEAYLQIGQESSTLRVTFQNIKVVLLMGSRDYFKLSNVTGSINEYGNPAYAVQIYATHMNLKRSYYGMGGVAYMTGQTYAKGKYTISFGAWNTREEEPKDIIIGFGKPQTEDVFTTVTLNGVSKMEYFEVELENTIDDAYLFITPLGGEGYANNTNMGFQIFGPNVTSVGLQELPNGGAIDGFPCVIMMNDEFHGLYTWNIPKDGWMFGMPKAILCADMHCDATKFKALATLNGDFELEYAEDEENTDWILPSLNTAIQAVINSDGTDIDTVVGRYIDIPSAIDYYIHTADEGAVDGNSKNYLLVTFDGVKWYFSAYDRDTTYGIHWQGTSFYSPKETVTFTNFATHHRLMGLIRNHKTAELKARAIELREGISSEANVATLFSNFISGIPSQLLDEDARKWPTIPSTSASNIAQIFNWYRLHRQVIDKEIDAM